MSSPTFARLTDRARELLAEHSIPGAAIGVLCDGQVETAGLGLTSVDHPLPVTPGAIFQIGSVTKTFVGSAVMRLVERGRIDLDAPLREYLPGLRLRDPEAQERASMRHLLTHTGGWRGDYFADLGWGDDALRLMVEGHIPELPQQTRLGETFSYNNSGFYLAGRAIELVTGRPFEAALGELVLGPLGLRSSLFFPHEAMLRRFAIGHIQRDGRPTTADPWPIGRAAHPAGGLVASVGDLLRYAQAHLEPDEALLGAESLEQMRAPHTSSVSILDSIGLTWFIYDVGGVRLINHGGATNGQIASLWLAPGRGFALAILTNAGNGGLLTRPIFQQAIGDYLGLADLDPAPIAARPDQLAALAGRYVGDLADTLVSLGDDGLTLTVVPKGGFPTPESPPPPAPPPMPLALYAPTRALVTAGPLQGGRAEFALGEGGRARWLRFGGRVRHRAGDI